MESGFGTLYTLKKQTKFWYLKGFFYVNSEKDNKAYEEENKEDL